MRTARNRGNHTSGGDLPDNGCSGGGFEMRIRICAAAVVVAMLSSIAPAQQGGGTQPGAQGSKTSSPDAQQQSGSSQRKGQSTSDGFSEKVVNALLDRVNSGFAAHSAPTVLSAFDRRRMRDYSRFAAALQSTFAQYESFRLDFHLLEVGGGGEAGSAVVEVQYEATPLSEVTPPVRKGQELRFQFVRTPQGW